MLQKFQNHIELNFKMLTNKKLLIAISGGLDSMVLLHVFQYLDYQIAIAHCNFQLRGLESFEDQNFINDYAIANNIPIFIAQFDTQNFANDYKLSTQVAARTLRYDWFNEILETKNYDFVLTAHHADDDLETFIINLSRASGLKGLIGIPEENNCVIRPFLKFSRAEIEAYANLNNIIWREDSSNASDKYLRNKIRHQAIPALKDISPNFLQSFQKSINYLQESQTMVDDAAIMVYQQVAKEVKNDIIFDLKKLKTLKNYKNYLHYWLQEFGFTAWNDIYDLVNAQTGKIIYANEYQLLKNRDQLILSLILDSNENEYYINHDQIEVKNPIKLSITKVNDIIDTDQNTIFVDNDKLLYPLKIRKWKSGDYFLPLGMSGQSKKVSKFFKDQKLSVLEKQNSWLLLSNNEIVWIIGQRQDERFTIENETKNKIQITII